MQVVAAWPGADPEFGAVPLGFSGPRGVRCLLGPRGGKDEEQILESSGYFVTFEGIEGAGKSTQIASTRSYLAARSIEAVVVREPGGTEVGDRVRDILLSPLKEPLAPLAELLLFCASRHQLVTTVIRPALAAGHVVLCDRFADSSRAYQGFGRGLPLDVIEQVNNVATGGLEPDLTIVLDVPPERGLNRVELRSGAAPGDRFETEALDFHRRVREGFLQLAREAPRRVAVVDAGRPAEQVTRAVLELIEHGIRRRLGT